MGFRESKKTITPVTKLSEDKLKTNSYGVVKLLVQNADGKFNPNSVTTPPKYITKIDGTDKYQFNLTEIINADNEANLALDWPKDVNNWGIECYLQQKLNKK